MFRKYSYYLKLLLTVLLLVLLFQLVDIQKLIGTFREANYFYIGIALLSIPLMISLKAYKWQILLRSFWKETSFKIACRSYLCGFAIGVITPAKIGEISRSMFLPYEENMKIISLVILDRYCDLIILIFLSIVGVTHFTGIKIGIIVFLAGLFGITVIFIYPAILEILNKKDYKLIWISKILKMQKDFNKITPKIFLKSLLISFGYFLLSITTSFLLLSSFTTVPFSVVLKVFPLTLLTNIIPITVGNLGVREGATIFLLNNFKISSAAAFNCSILLFFFHSIIPALLGSLLINLRIKKT